MYSSRLMLAPVLRRRYATTSAPGSSQSNYNNTLLLIAGATAAAGAYYYYLRGRPVDDVSTEAKRHEEAMAQRARESLEAGKAHVVDARKQALDDVKKTGGEDKVKARLKSAEVSVEQTLQDAESRMKEIGSEAKAKASRAYNETKSTAEQKVGEARGALESKGEEVKRGWLSWLGWGNSRAREQQGQAAAEQGKEKHT